MSLSRGASQKSGGGLGSRKGSALSLKDMVLRRGSSRKELFTTVGEGLRQHYNKTLKPFEELHGFHTLHSPPLEDADFTGKPSVLLVGQYSTGKTTLIRYLLGEDFMGCRIGPEPTTDKFHVIMAAEEEGEDPPSSVVVPGNALVVDPQLPFRPKRQNILRHFHFHFHFYFSKLPFRPKRQNIFLEILCLFLY